LSYDLYFRPGAGTVDEADVLDYFRARPNYSIENDQIMYANEDTGVYFTFDLGGDEADPEEIQCAAALNVNFYRPSYFIREAELETTAFVRRFGWTVFDPQTHGMGEGEYSADKLISGYNAGNEFAYSAILQEMPALHENSLTLPTNTLTRIWQWNHGRQKLQEDVGEVKFVPRIIFVLLDGKLSTIAVWTDVMSAELPMVDHFLVVRDELAPRRFLKKTADKIYLAWNDVIEILERHGARRPDGAISLEYGLPPKEMIDLITSLKPEERQVSLVAVDQVLDRELVEKALANS
jgi:hypothetical protein